MLQQRCARFPSLQMLLSARSVWHTEGTSCSAVWYPSMQILLCTEDFADAAPESCWQYPRAAKGQQAKLRAFCDACPSSQGSLSQALLEHKSLQLCISLSD